MLGAIPYEGIKFGAFALFKGQRPEDNSTIWNLYSGAFGGAVASTLMYPNDTIRRILQVQGTALTAGGKVPTQQYTGMIDCYRQTFLRHGMRRFYNGLGACAPAVVPRHAPDASSRLG